MTLTTERLRECKILIVEDDGTTAAVLKKYLSDAGYTHLYFAENGEIALGMTYDILPDIVILDMLMPEMDGFEYCRHMLAEPKFSGIPILVQTVLENKSDKLRAFSIGASDYLTKPIHPEELLARIQVHLANKILREEIIARQKQMHAELQAAQEMQINLMPSAQEIESSARLYNMDIAQHFETSSMLGGDFWSMHRLTDTRLAIYMLDFSGHGITAALNVFRIHTLIKSMLHEGNDAGQFLTSLNHHIYQLIDRSEFATMFYGIVDIDANCLEYSAAAMPPILLTHAEGKHHEWLDNRGLPLGASSQAPYTTLYTPFAAGDALVMFSDCLIESKNADGKMLGEKEIAACVGKALNETSPHKATHILDALLQHFRTHSPDPIHDDLTLNVYYRR